MSKAWETTLKKIRQHEGKTEAISETEIAEAERALGIPLPKSYKEFCRRIGSVRWPVYVEGLRAIVQARQENPVSHDNPEFLLVFGSDGGEVQYAFDTRRMLDGEYPVAFVDLEEGHEDDADPESAGDGFAECLSDLVVEAEAQERADQLKTWLSGSTHSCNPKSEFRVLGVPLPKRSQRPRRGWA